MSHNMIKGQFVHKQINWHYDTLKINISGSTGEDHLKGAFLSFISSAIKNGSKNVLINNNDLGHHISPHFQSWAQQNLELPLFHAGVEKIAIVHPSNAEYFNLISKQDTKRRRYFQNEADATAWLNS